MIFKLLNPTTALAIGTISDYNLHSAYHNMHLHVHLTDYLLFPLLLQRTLYEVFKYVGVPVEEIGYNQPAGVRYPTENPWG